jgi:hypothetical protein
MGKPVRLGPDWPVLQNNCGRVPPGFDCNGACIAVVAQRVSHCHREVKRRCQCLNFIQQDTCVQPAWSVTVS